MRILNEDGIEYRTIPGHPEVSISCDGIVKLLGDTLPVHRQSGGYVASSHGVDNLTTLRHRLVLMAWKPLPDNYLELDCNHKNSVPGDDRADNLEWCTRKENIEHSVRKGRFHNKPVYVKDGLSGVVRHHHSLAMAQRIEGVKDSGISRGLLGHPFYRHKSGRIFGWDKMDLDNKISWTREERLKYGMPVVTNKVTGNRVELKYITEITRFGLVDISLPTLAHRLNTLGSHISDTILIQFKIDDDILDIDPINPNMPVRGNSRIRRHGGDDRTIRVYDVIAESESTFPTLTDAARHLSITTGQLSNALDNNDMRIYSPHHRYSRDPNATFPKRSTFSDIAKICGYRLVAADGSILIDAASSREYGRMTEKLGYGNQCTVTKNKMAHQRKMSQMGLSIQLMVKNVGYITDDYVSIRRL